MSFGVKVGGLEDLDRKFGALADTMRKRIAQELGETALLIASDTVKVIQAKSPGSELVTRYGPDRGQKRRSYRSKPGKAPNTDLGGLAASYGSWVDKKRLKARSGSDLKYATFLELGTRDMQARPHFYPAYKKNTKGLQKRVTAVMKSVIKQTEMK